MKRVTVVALAILMVAQLAAACQSAQPTATAKPLPTAAPTAITEATSPPPATSAQVEAGHTTFSQNCARCHGTAGGRGPALNPATLAKYGTAKGLFDKISTTMPQSAPGTLTRQQYYDIIAYLLSSLGIMRADQVVGADTAASIPTK
jgi:mono/diheme cytochrome c family protein